VALCPTTVGFADVALPTQQTLARIVGVKTVWNSQSIDSRVPKASAAKLQLGGARHICVKQQSTPLLPQFVIKANSNRDWPIENAL
jgi:hypothetical protein